MEGHRLVNNPVLRWANSAILWLFCLVLSACSGLAPASQMPCFSCDDQRLVRIVPLTQVPDQKRLLHHPFGLQREDWCWSDWISRIESSIRWKVIDS